MHIMPIEQLEAEVLKKGASYLASVIRSDMFYSIAASS